MSSLTRRIQINTLKKASKTKLPIVTDGGDVIGQKWPIRKGQLFFLDDLKPVFAHTEHPTLQPVVAALSKE